MKYQADETAKAEIDESKKTCFDFLSFIVNEIRFANNKPKTSATTDEILLPTSTAVKRNTKDPLVKNFDLSLLSNKITKANE